MTNNASRCHDTPFALPTPYRIAHIIIAQVENSTTMIQFHFLGGTVGFDNAFYPQIIEITFKAKIKYFKNDFTGILPLGGGEHRGVEHMV
jgi:hypothetical protein